MTKTRIALLALCLTVPVLLSAQKYFTRNAVVYFDATSKNSPERVEATSKGGTLVMDLASAKIESAVLIKGFLFEKALMQEHFNENYMESTKYPKAVFKGKIENPDALSLDKSGTYKAALVGEFSVHGITKQIKTPAVFEVKDGKVVGKATFEVKLKDYDIDVPSVVSDKLADTARITVEAELEKM